MRKITHFAAICGFFLFLFAALPWAGAYGGGVEAEKKIWQTGREDGREFVLRYEAWMEDALGQPEPGMVLLTVDNSGAAAGESDKIRGEVDGFLEQLAEDSPRTEVAVIRAGGRDAHAGGCVGGTAVWQVYGDAAGPA